MLLFIGSKYPLYCGCGFFIKYNQIAYHHRKTCTAPIIKTKADIDHELVFEMANIQLDIIEREFKSDWLMRYGTLDNYPLK